MKKLLLTITILALIVCFGSVIYAAEDEGVADLTESATTLTTTEAVASDTTATTDTAAGTVSDTGSSPFPDADTPAEGEPPTEEGETSLEDISALIEEMKAKLETEEPQNVFHWLIYKLCGDWAPIVYLVLVAALGVFLVVFEVKKKLPADQNFRETIAKGFKAFSENTAIENNTFTTDVNKKVGEMKTAITDALASISAVIEKVEAIQKEQDIANGDREVLKTILTNETEMLNTIIQASTLAQWRKDEIGALHKQNLEAVASMTTDTTKPTTDTTEGGEGE